MTFSDETVKEPRPVSKWPFECLVIVTMVLLAVTEALGAVVVSRALRLRFEGGYIGGLTILNLWLARPVVDGIFKWFGLSRSGKTLEVRGRAVVSPEGSVGDDEVVEVYLPRSFARFVIWGCPVACVLFAAMGTLMFDWDPCFAVLSYLMSGYFGFCTMINWWDRRPEAWADRDGITGYPIGRFCLRRRFVPWSDVARCEIETLYNTFGEPVVIRPALKGWNGELLMTLNLLYKTMQDQERLVKYIKAKLPKPKPTVEDDFWE
jgi:hypothetical protein